MQKEVLQQAVDAKNLLIKIGKKPEMDPVVKRLLAQMVLKSDKLNKSAVTAATQTKISELIGLLK